MRRSTFRRRTAAAVVAVTTAALALTTAPGTATASGDDRPHRWTGAWGAAHQAPVDVPGWPRTWSVDGFTDQSVRQVVRVAAAGERLRIRVSNEYGARPLRVVAATVGRTGDGAAVRPGTVRTVRFGGDDGIVVPPGRELASDPVGLPVRALERLTVTLHFAGPTGPVGFHPEGLTTTYRATGDRTRDTSGGPFAGETAYSYYALSGIDVTGAEARGTVVAFGDSITDGYGSTPDADNRYPDQLAERLTEARSRLSVVNSGISGNRLLSDSPCFGVKAKDRFGHDVLNRPGVRKAVVLLGVNDIGAAGLADFGCGVAPAVTASQLIDGHKDLIRQARARGVEVVGATVLPFKGTGDGYYTETKDRVRQEVNHWIRTSGAYDAVADTDLALRDPADPARLLPAYDSGDHLHPNDAGLDALAAAVLPHVTGD
ncbi:SGNH/GDSL hydrolase family protein [Streptomyces sp. NPDC020875]|uniref:SGNH/GDSL hydrolase family protein n=1 Tax=Streptomyces sp. NPDC020875 TaxID=3154898 RepID=UPI0033ECD7D5